MDVKLNSAQIISQWAADPSAMIRLEQIVLLTQRTNFIKQLLLIPDAEEKQLRSQIKIILDKHSIVYTPPRGRQGGARNMKPLDSRIRYGISVLLGIHMNTDDGGVVVNQEGRLLSTDTLDRLIYAYHRYLQLHRVTATDATVNFELFVKCWQAIQLGDAVLEVCSNCGSAHVNFRVAMAHTCPVCINLNLAELPKQSNRVSNYDPLSNQVFRKTY